MNEQEWLKPAEGTFELSGTWSEDGAYDRLWQAFGEPTQRVTIIPQSHQLWRLAVYPMRYAFDAKVESSSNTFGTQATFTPVGPVTIVRAEWWRLALWYACAPFRWFRQTERP